MSADPQKKETEKTPLWLLIVYSILILWCLWSILQYWE